MKIPDHPSVRAGWAAGVAAAYGLLLGAAAWLLYDPPARYLASAPLCLLRWDVVAESLSRAGGGVDTLGAWLAQGDSRGWLGAAAFGCMAAWVSLATWLVWRRLGGRPSGVVGVPGLLLLVLYGQPHVPVMAVAVAVNLALSALLVWVALRRRSRPAWLALFAVLAGLLWYGAGALACLLFLVLGGLFAWRGARDGRPKVPTT